MKTRLATSVALATILAFGTATLPTPASAEDRDAIEAVARPSATTKPIQVPAFAGTVVLSVGGFVKQAATSRTTAPNSFAVDGGRVYLHDPLRESVAVFDHGKRAGVAVQGLDRSALDLLNYDGKLYVLANDDEVLTYAAKDDRGRLRETPQSSVVRRSPNVARSVEGTEEPIGVAPVHADRLTVVNGGVYATNPNAVTLQDLRIESSRGFGLIVIGDHSIVRRVNVNRVVPQGAQTGAAGIVGNGCGRRQKKGKNQGFHPKLLPETRKSTTMPAKIAAPT